MGGGVLPHSQQQCEGTLPSGKLPCLGIRVARFRKRTKTGSSVKSEFQMNNKKFKYIYVLVQVVYLKFRFNEVSYMLSDNSPGSHASLERAQCPLRRRSGSGHIPDLKAVIAIETGLSHGGFP